MNMNEMQEMDSTPQVEEVALQQEEKLLPQSQVNKLIAREKESAAMRARQQAEAEYQQKLEAISQQANAQQERNAQVPRDIDANAIYQQVQEKFNQEMQHKALLDEMTQVANTYHSKMAAGKDSYEDFDHVTGDFDAAAFPQLTYLVSGLDNAADVIYELAKNPQKLITLNSMVKEQPAMGQRELQKLARSISENRLAQSAAGGQATSAPLDRLNPSRVSGSNGKMTVSDLRNQPWLRG